MSGCVQTFGFFVYGRDFYHISTMKARAAAISLVFISGALIADEKDARIVQSDGSGLVVEFVPSYRPVKTILVNGQPTAHYSFHGGISAAGETPGSPENPIRSILLRFKGLRNSVEVLKTEYEDVPNVLLSPAPGFRKGDLDLVPVYSLENSPYSRPGFVPEKLVSLEKVGETRGAFLGNLVIHPLQYDPASRTLRKFSKILVRVNFQSSDPVRISSAETPALNNGMFPKSLIAVSAVAKKVLRNSVLQNGSWWRFPVTEDGIYKLDGQTLLNLGIPAGTDPATIRIFGNGGFETSSSVTDPVVDDLVENAVYLSDGGTTGHLDASDYILFYGKGTRGWRYDPSTKSYVHYLNHFTETNSYWLSSNGTPSKRMTAVPSLSQASPFQPPSAAGKIFREDERINILSSGQEWLGQAFNSGDQITYVQPLTSLDPNQRVSYRFRIGAGSSTGSTFTVSEHGIPLFSAGIPGTYTDGLLYYYSSQFVSSVIPTQVTPSQFPGFTDGESQMRFVFTTGSATGVGYLDWYEIVYKKFLNSRNDVFNFSAHDTTAVTEYDVSGFSGSQVLVFDVTRFDSAVVITSPRIIADTCAFQVQLSSGSSKEFYVVGPGGFKSASGFSRVPNQNLHGDDPGAQFIIVSHGDFMSAAQRLKAYRELPGNSLKTFVVDADQVYNEFGGGLLSPQAIRNFLKYAYTNWAQPPSYVLLFGDGDYDYRRIVASGTNWMPPWETFESFIPISTYSSDDQYAILTPDDRVDLKLGRLAPRSARDADALVDKIIEYETHPANDPWKLRFTFVADDGPQAPGLNDGFIHTQQSDDVSAILPDLFEKRKIYLYEYPTVIAPGGRRKPTVNVAIDNQINQGTLVLNFTGHGNPRLWANEQVFVRESDFGELHNAGKYFFLVAATCNYSHFDMLNDQSGGEILSLMPQAGAIGVFSATRPVLSFDNFLLNETLYRNLFRLDTLGRAYPERIGDVIYRTKQVQTSENDRKYFLLCDPSLQLDYPKFFATIDSINHVPGRQVVQLKALERSTISATVRDTATGLPVNTSGQAEITVFDANHGVTLTDPDLNASYTYVASGSSLFRGEASINSGSINSSFIVPRDISYSNNRGRISLYFANGPADGAGYTTNILISGTDTTAAADVTGPVIQLYLDNRGFKAGDLVSASPTLIADISDSSGINTSTSGVGHRIEAWLDNQTESIDLSDYYKSNLNTFQSGTVEYSLGNLGEGSHKLKLRAWDTYNNSSTVQTVFDVITGVGLKITNVYNFPNPFSTTTAFTFQHNQILPVDAEVKIFTVAGRLIRSLKTVGATTQFVRIPWDGRDKDGDILANGVYLYKLIARTEDGRFSTEALGKLSVAK